MIVPVRGKWYSFMNNHEVELVGLGRNNIEAKFFVFKPKYSEIFLIVEKEIWYSTEVQQEVRRQ